MFRSSPLFQFKHGDHVCVFYRSQRFLQGILTPYISEGLIKGERCFLAQKPEVLRTLLFDLQFLGFDTDREVKRGALELHTIDEVYFSDGVFDSARLMDLLMRTVQTSAQQGFTSFRSAGELCWAAHSARKCDQLVEYERMVNEQYPGKAAIGMCQYPMNEFPAEVLQAILNHHKMHIGDSASNSGSMYSSIDICYPGYRAEIVADKYVIDPKYYYVIQERLPGSIVAWGTEPTFEHASEQAEQIIRAAGAA